MLTRIARQNSDTIMNRKQDKFNKIISLSVGANDNE